MKMNTRKGQNTIHMGQNIIEPINSLERDFEKMRLEKEIEEANAMYLELEKQKQAELDAKLATLEILPMFNKIILLPYPTNPYRKILNGSIIVEYTGNFLNPDSGEQDTLNTFVGCAKIIEVGPEVKYLKDGDDVFYDTRTCYPIPFLKMGYLSTQENQIICVLNEGLKKRFNMN
jgi:hypothetical protein